jgi:hypothetical protein
MQFSANLFGGWIDQVHGWPITQGLPFAINEKLRFISHF